MPIWPLVCPWPEPIGRASVDFMGKDAASFPPAMDSGLSPSCGVHTLAMRFPIDVLYLDSDKHVVHVEENLKPWRVAKVSLQTVSVLELPGNTLKSSGTAVGDEIEIALSSSTTGQPSEATTA